MTASPLPRRHVVSRERASRGDRGISPHVNTDDGSYSADRIVPGTYDCTITLADQPLGGGHLMIRDGRRPLLPVPGSSVTFAVTAGQHLDLGTIKVTEISQLPTGDTAVIRAQSR